MNRFVVVLAAAMFAAGGARAQSAAPPVGAPLELRQSVPPPSGVPALVPARPHQTAPAPAAAATISAPKAVAHRKATVHREAIRREKPPAAKTVARRAPRRPVAAAPRRAAGIARGRVGSDGLVETEEDRRRSNALNDLSAHGYGDFANFHRDGDRYVATIHRGGRDLTVTADPRSGQVTQSP
jgi:hypothetical protein